MDKRKTTLEDYGISKKRLKELSGFCEQYPEWKQELAMKDSTLRSPQLTGMPASRKNTDATGDLAVRRAELEAKCRLIEETAREANAELCEYIIQAVCFEISIPYLMAHEEMPCSQASFYDLRKYFFCLLNQKKRNFEKNL